VSGEDGVSPSALASFCSLSTLAVPISAKSLRIDSGCNTFRVDAAQIAATRPEESGKHRFPLLVDPPV